MHNIFSPCHKRHTYSTLSKPTTHPCCGRRHSFHSADRGAGQKPAHSAVVLQADTQCQIQHIFLSNHRATGQRMARQTSNVAAHCSAARRSQDTCSTRACTSCDMISWLCQPQRNPHMHRQTRRQQDLEQKRKLCGGQASMWTPATATSRTHS